MVVGFYVHTDMNFVITERRENGSKASAYLNGDFKMEAAALPGAYEE